jgi:predicted  nucleic acid-binding Zn-ribbon protein
LKEQIQLLEQLQEIDNQIDRYRGDLDRLPVEVQELARNLVVIRREMSEAREKTPEIEKELRKKESDLAIEQEKIKRSERRLLTIKNQKEYNALSREVKLGKKVASEIEDAILNFMAEIETLKKTVDKKEKDYESFEQAFLKKKSESESAGAQAKEALVSLGQERDKIISALEQNLLKKYETVRQARGNAVAEVKNGSCTGCYMAIPAQLSIRVLKQEEMITCPNCQRILYVKPENIPEFNKLDS